MKHPEPDPNLPNKSPRHTHKYWDKALNRYVRKTCICDTGRDHTTPKEG
jgi:hypothetical protein